MKKIRKPDKILLTTLALILGIGLIALISASFEQSKQDFGNIYGYALHQLIYGFLAGGALGFLAYKIPYRMWEKFALPFFLLSIVLMVLVLVPGVGIVTRGSQRWLDFKIATFQPSELLKLSFVIYLAAWLNSHTRELKKLSTFISFIMFLGVLGVLLLLQPNLSTFGIIVLTGGCMYFMAGGSLKHIFSFAGAGIAAFYIFIKTSEYRSNRLLTFLNPTKDPLGLGYQINQLLIAVGSGNIFGLGIFNGTQKNFLPLAMNDSIYAVWAEETGFIGAGILLLLYIVFAWRAFRIVLSLQNNFAKLTSVGLIVWIFLQATINIAAILGVFPLTGITLPFISYGSSSLVVTMIAAGLLLQISKKAS